VLRPVSSVGVLGLGVVIACSAPPNPIPIEAVGFRGLLTGAASVTAADTVCLSVATSDGEADPSPSIVHTVQAEFPHVLLRAACRTTSPEPPTVRLVSVRRENDSTIEVLGETVAEHLQRHRCTINERTGVAACTGMAPESAADSGHVPPT
jgi:hypothetical protein